MTQRLSAYSVPSGSLACALAWVIRVRQATLGIRQYLAVAKVERFDPALLAKCETDEEAQFH
ncbi:MAG TPA: hypothetical protein VF808_11935 [Ktedonobacterales bacterium]